MGCCPLGFLSGTRGTGNGERRLLQALSRQTRLSGAITGREEQPLPGAAWCRAGLPSRDAVEIPRPPLARSLWEHILHPSHFFLMGRYSPTSSEARSDCLCTSISLSCIPVTVVTVAAPSIPLSPCCRHYAIAHGFSQESCASPCPCPWHREGNRPQTGDVPCPRSQSKQVAEPELGVQSQCPKAPISSAPAAVSPPGLCHSEPSVCESLGRKLPLHGHLRRLRPGLSHGNPRLPGGRPHQERPSGSALTLATSSRPV